jgi:hypothetical protein
LAIRTADTLDDINLPSEQVLDKYRELAAPQADEILRKYEHFLLVSQLSSDVIEKLRDDLVPRSRASRLIEVGINVSAVVIGALIGLSQFIFDPVNNVKQITAVYYALMFIVIVQLIGNLYLRYFDSRR